MFRELSAAMFAALLASGAVGAAELRPIQSTARMNGAAVHKIERGIMQGLQQVLPTYPASVVIEPIVSELRFESGGKRFWLGAMAGSSRVNVRVRITSGGQTFEKSFYQDSGAWKGAWTVGAADNYMLERVAHDAVEYVMQRPWEAVGKLEGAVESGTPTQAAEGVSSPQAAPPVGSAIDALYNDLTKLDDLRKRGLITEEEFEARKKRILEKP